jgi:hypothetical protein
MSIPIEEDKKELLIQAKGKFVFSFVFINFCWESGCLNRGNDSGNLLFVLHLSNGATFSIWGG